jgi:hypothetical protein
MGALRQDGLADETVGRNMTLTLSSVQFLTRRVPDEAVSSR